MMFDDFGDSLADGIKDRIPNTVLRWFAILTINNFLMFLGAFITEELFTL